MMKRLATAVLAALLVIGAVTGSFAGQYGTDFKYKNLKEMEDDGWVIYRRGGVSLDKNGVVLDGTGGTCSIFITNNLPGQVLDWKAGARGAWLGGKGSSWLDVGVNTEKHQYMCLLDGSTGSYYLLRDGIAVAQAAGYSGIANQMAEMYIEKLGSTISISVNGKVMGTYKETDPSRVVTAGIISPYGSAARYVWAGVFIPETSLAGGTGDPAISGDGTEAVTGEGDTGPTPPEEAPPETPAANPQWENYDPSQIPDISTITNPQTGIQDNPGTGMVPTLLNTEEPIPAPPPPPPLTEDAAEGSTAGMETGTTPLKPSMYTPVWIVVNPCLFVMNTNPSEENSGAAAEAGHFLFTGVGQIPYVNIADAADAPASRSRTCLTRE